MGQSFIENSVEIKAPQAKVWRVFADPAITKKMGGEYVTDWEPGSSFGWRNAAGTMLTNGMILQLEAGRLIKHSLFAPGSTEVISVITYSFIENNGSTILNAREELLSPLEPAAYEASLEGWRAALHAVKDLAEKI